MDYAGHLISLLEPLGIYSFDGFGGGELHALGAQLDEAGALTEIMERESVVLTAEDYGLDLIEELFAGKPVATSLKYRRNAISSLLRVSGDSFTLEALRTCINGCGVVANLNESSTPGTVIVDFPEIMGEPTNYRRIKKIIEDILPCHLYVKFALRYLTFYYMELWQVRWQELDGLTWADAQVYGGYQEYIDD